MTPLPGINGSYVLQDGGLKFVYDRQYLDQKDRRAMYESAVKATDLARVKRLRKTGIAYARVLRAVSEATGVSVEEVTGKCRLTTIAMARHLSWYVARAVTDCSLHEIARLHGCDHSSIAHGVKKVALRLATDVKLSGLILKAYDGLEGK